MLNRYVMKDGKKMKYGITTGSCAAAASKAATIMALTRERIDHVSIDTPKGWKVKLKVEDYKIEDDYASCSVKKDAGDDPDNTHGIMITSTVEIIDEPKVEIRGGTGVGIVTKPGLAVSPGNPAINPVPQMMIQKEVSEVLPEGKGVIIIISVPKGEEVAKKTFNPKLGIVGGISILGTSGIVEPMSEEAFKASLALEISMASKEGIKKMILVPGNYGRDMARDFYGFNEKYIIKTSNFIGYMLEKCVEYGIDKVLMVGHIGKFVKLAGGIFHTHSKVADGRIEILAANLALMGADQGMIKEIFECVTTEGALDIIEKRGFHRVYKELCEKAEKKCIEHVYDQLEIGVIMFSMNKEILSTGPKAQEILEEFKNE